jgi:4-oxalocrotonate tautomerase
MLIARAFASGAKPIIATGGFRAGRRFLQCKHLNEPEPFMPILNVRVGAPRTPELSGRITEALLELTTRVLGKRRDLTAVVITYVDPNDWYVAGRSLAELGQSSCYFDVKVVDETNTKAEKARYVAEAFETFERLLGNVHPESYVYVQDVRATAYGFGGRTQEYRFQHPNP